MPSNAIAQDHFRSDLQIQDPGKDNSIIELEDKSLTVCQVHGTTSATFRKTSPPRCVHQEVTFVLCCGDSVVIDFCHDFTALLEEVGDFITVKAWELHGRLTWVCYHTGKIRYGVRCDHSIEAHDFGLYSGAVDTLESEVASLIKRVKELENRASGDASEGAKLSDEATPSDAGLVSPPSDAPADEESQSLKKDTEEDGDQHSNDDGDNLQPECDGG